MLPASQVGLKAERPKTCEAGFYLTLLFDRSLKVIIIKYTRSNGVRSVSYLGEFK